MAIHGTSKSRGNMKGASEDRIPNRLHELGQVFFPIPPRKKGWKYPHSQEEYRYSPGDATLDAYLEYGTWGYGIACADDLIVVDIDDKGYLEDVTSMLPMTLHQHTGSGDGVHIFYKAPDVEQGASLHDPEENVHVGDIKAHERSYVVGPGSTHPSGNKYGPIFGDSINTVDKELINELVEEYSRESPEVSGCINIEESTPDSVHDLYSITANDVRPDMSTESRTTNPFHGSSTGTNFMKNEDGETFTCWRCDSGSGPGCGLNGSQYLACKGLDKFGNVSNNHCGYVRRRWGSDNRLHYYAWDEAVGLGIIEPTDPPYKVVTGYGMEEGFIDSVEDVDFVLYNQMENSLLYSHYWL